MIGWEHLESTIEGDQVFFRFSSLSSQLDQQFTSADRAVLALDRARYEALMEGKTPTKEPQGEQPSATDRRLLGGWEVSLLEALGLPAEPGLVHSLLLQGRVVLELPGARLHCQQLRYDRASGETGILKADLLLPPESGLRGWPMRLICEDLQEFPDGRLLARDALLTTCDFEPPHFALRLDQVDGRPMTPSGWSWKPEGTWLEVAGIALLPLPSPEISTADTGDDSFFGLRGVRLGSDNRLGESLGLDLGTSGRTSGNSTWSATVQPTWSLRRGFPLGGSFQSSGTSWKAQWSLFTLDDQGKDAHPFSRRIDLPGDNRWLASGNHRFDFGEEWRMDVDLAFASDPLVQPEFFREGWETGDDLQSQIYLRQPAADHFTELDISAVTDTAGFSPLAGFGTDAPLYREDLPRIRHEAFPRTIDLDVFGEFFSLDLSWGANFSRIQLRDLDPLAVAGTNPFAEPDNLRFDRLHLWAEASSPVVAKGLVIRPGLRTDMVAWSGEMDDRRDAARAVGEGFLEISTLLAQRYEDGWKHRLRPMVRLRARGTQGQDADQVPQADFVDSLDDGEVVEFSLRQFFLAPKSSQPWLDLDFMIPWYPDPTRPLLDPLFPGPRVANPSGDSWGPAEVRLLWRPDKSTPALQGWSLGGGFRHDLAQRNTEEVFARLGVRPNKNLRLGVSMRKVDDLFSYGELWGNWRVTRDWAMGFRLPHAFAFAPARRARLSFSWYSHDFVLQLEGVRNDATGETGFGFNILPRFLVDAPLRRVRPGG